MRDPYTHHPLYYNKKAGREREKINDGNDGEDDDVIRMQRRERRWPLIATIIRGLF